MDMRKQFIIQMERIMKVKEEMDTFIDKLDETIGVSDYFIEEFYKGHSLAIDNLIGWVSEWWAYMTGKSHIAQEVEDDITYYIFEDCREIWIDDKKIDIDTPADLWDMWKWRYE